MKIEFGIVCKRLNSFGYLDRENITYSCYVLLNSLFLKLIKVQINIDLNINDVIVLIKKLIFNSINYGYFPTDS